MGDVRILTAEGPVWCVSGSNGENAVSARGWSQAEAWHRACLQAEAVGMLRSQGRCYTGTLRVFPQNSS